MGNEPKICIAGKHPTSLENTARLLRVEGFSVLVCQSRENLLHAIKVENLFCILIEADLLEIDESGFLPFQQHGLPVIFMAATASVAAAVEAMKAGAIDFFVEPVDPSRLLAAVRKAMLKFQECRELVLTRRKFSLLTRREKEVFEFVTAGMLNKQIAAQLGISEKTIKVHRGRVMRKMEARSIAELVRWSDRFAHSANHHRPTE